MRVARAAEVRFRAAVREPAASVLLDMYRAFAVELGPRRIETGTKKRAVRPRSKWLIGALAAEVKRQRDVLNELAG